MALVMTLLWDLQSEKGMLVEAQLKQISPNYLHYTFFLIITFLESIKTYNRFNSCTWKIVVELGTSHNIHIFMP